MNEKLAVERIKKFCAEWKKFKSNYQKEIYGLNTGSEREAILYMADLEELVTPRASGDVDALPCVGCGKPSNTCTPDDAEMCWECYGEFNAAAYDELKKSYDALISRESAWKLIDENTGRDGSPILAGNINYAYALNKFKVVFWQGADEFEGQPEGFYMPDRETPETHLTHWKPLDPLPAPPLGDKL